MSTDNKTNHRQEIYNKISESSKDEYILSEMIRLGFVDNKNFDKDEFARILKEEFKLQNEYRDLLKKQIKLSNKEEILKEIRLRRMAESRAKQKENAEKRKHNFEIKKKLREEKNKTDIQFLGKEYIGQINKKASDLNQLKKNGLEPINSIKELSEYFKISIPMIKFLCYSPTSSEINHYKRFTLNKKTGGQRTISAPMPKLKYLQNKIKHEILDKICLHKSACGFVSEKSIIDNAKPHIGKKFLINLDLEDFFPNISYKRVYGIFKSLGYSSQISCTLALACTEPDIAEVKIEDKKYFTALSERYLPQGAPSSPMITNILCRKLDSRLSGLAKKYKFQYTRYADDISFSGNDYYSAIKILNFAKQIIKNEGLKINDKKTSFTRNNNRQEVTGIIVNEKLSIDNRKIKKFRALLHNIEKNGLEKASWEGKKSHELLGFIEGYFNFIKMIDSKKSKKYKKQVKSILKKYNYEKTDGIKSNKTVEYLRTKKEELNINKTNEDLTINIKSTTTSNEKNKNQFILVRFITIVFNLIYLFSQIAVNTRISNYLVGIFCITTIISISKVLTKSAYIRFAILSIVLFRFSYLYFFNSYSYGFIIIEIFVILLLSRILKNITK
ncbi:MAG: reverse transcriptase domain-containing protein [Marinifilaceae bacterium]|jgi:hypothetical protein|nr:reverse transcriptase domain-containing protein [Marinifilaceae bacterium]